MSEPRPKLFRVRFQYDVSDRVEGLDPADFTHCSSSEQLRDSLLEIADEQNDCSAHVSDRDVKAFWDLVQAAQKGKADG